jgi:hypothetical protein
MIRMTRFALLKNAKAAEALGVLREMNPSDALPRVETGRFIKNTQVPNTALGFKSQA